MKRIKIGLMLGGGGAKGAYQLGVIRALEEANLLKHIQVISGTSIGAINTLLLMSKKNHSMIEKIWEDLDTENVFGTKGNLFDKVSRMYSIEPLAQKLISKIDIKEIKKSKYQGFATASVIYSKTSMTHQLKTDTMEKKVFHLNQEEDPYLAVMASASIPVLFGPTKIKDTYYVDGGMLDNYPMMPLIENGCQLIFAVAVDDRFNPHLYDHLNIHIVDFTAQNAFEKNITLDYLDMLKFEQKFKDQKSLLGYIAGSTMIERLYQEGIIRSFLGMKFFKIPNTFKVLGLPNSAEQTIKDVNQETKKEFKKLEKLQKRLEKEAKGK